MVTKRKIPAAFKAQAAKAKAMTPAQKAAWVEKMRKAKAAKAKAGGTKTRAKRARAGSKAPPADNPPRKAKVKAVKVAAATGGWRVLNGDSGRVVTAATWTPAKKKAFVAKMKRARAAAAKPNPPAPKRAKTRRKASAAKAGTAASSRVVVVVNNTRAATGPTRDAALAAAKPRKGDTVDVYAGGKCSRGTWA